MFPGSHSYPLLLMRKLLKFDVDKRISIRDALHDSYLKEWKRDKKLRTKELWNLRLRMYFILKITKGEIHIGEV